jgi:hypothetical protein
MRRSGIEGQHIAVPRTERGLEDARQRGSCGLVDVDDADHSHGIGSADADVEGVAIT